jgi:hypothetical protein
LRYLNLTTYQHAQKALQHNKISLVAEKTFYHPIKPYVISHSVAFFGDELCHKYKTLFSFKQKIPKTSKKKFSGFFSAGEPPSLQNPNPTPSTP